MTTTSTRRPSRRSPSFLSSSSSSSIGSTSIYLDDSSAPATPLRYFGIPFSWEQIPGIAKKNISKNDSQKNLLPLPPSGSSFRKSFGKDSPSMNKKYSTSESFRKDPFFAAFVECSKDEKQLARELVKGSKNRVPRVYNSCKRTCQVAESIVYLPRSSRAFYR
ncbi:hypothetical protein CTI12_AA131030 [Artemisia annua]|uniref:Uncharacterized protein n=1 Tax=Artemisia annua TaxID=35608 RepID=A0A2U1PNV3_ARTAN|nr:hypothetical protein CTI12_AA131030 [Artemisia annua]